MEVQASAKTQETDRGCLSPLYSIMKNLTQTHINKRPRGNKRSKDEQIRIMNDIFSLSANHNDYEIMDTLKIPNQTYYRIKSKMYGVRKKNMATSVQRIAGI